MNAPAATLAAVPTLRLITLALVRLPGVGLAGCFLISSFGLALGITLLGGAAGLTFGLGLRSIVTAFFLT
jgi:hypothetical protein